MSLVSNQELALIEELDYFDWISTFKGDKAGTLLSVAKGPIWQVMPEGFKNIFDHVPRQGFPDVKILAICKLPDISKTKRARVFLKVAWLYGFPELEKMLERRKARDVLEQVRAYKKKGTVKWEVVMTDHWDWIDFNSLAGLAHLSWRCETTGLAEEEKFKTKEGVKKKKEMEKKEKKGAVPPELKFSGQTAVLKESKIYSTRILRQNEEDGGKPAGGSVRRKRVKIEKSEND